jgi:hypothetical protein
VKPGLGKATPAWTSTRIKVIDISEVNRIVNLLRKVNCKKYALISDVAKEMGVKKTALMQFIEDNPKLFRTNEIFNTKKSLGLAICDIYQTAEENPETEEWIEAQKKKWEKKIHVGERTYYGCHQYWVIPEDSVEYKEGKYRNTPEKIQELVDAGVIKKTTRCYGALGDAYNEEVFFFNDDMKKAIEDYGWTTDFDVVSANAKK